MMREGERPPQRNQESLKESTSKKAPLDALFDQIDESFPIPTDYDEAKEYMDRHSAETEEWRRQLEDEDD